MLLFRPRLLKLQVSNRKLFKDWKTHFNITATFITHIPITKTKGIRFLVFKGYIGKVV